LKFGGGGGGGIPMEGCGGGAPVEDYYCVVA